MASSYHIIFPCGNRSRLSVIEIYEGLEYELNDYSVASRRSFFDDRSAAVQYARQLAKENGLSFISTDGDDCYLD